MPPDLDHLLALADAGHPVSAIAQRFGIPAGRVYSTLRTHRPNRTRSPRTPTSDVPAKVRALRAGGASVGRCVELLCVTRQYVWKCEQGADHAV